jgi:hypothetical protein
MLTREAFRGARMPLAHPSFPGTTVAGNMGPRFRGDDNKYIVVLRYRCDNPIDP